MNGAAGSLFPVEVARPVLYPHQEAAKCELRNQLRAGHKNLLAVGPTGVGKTVIIASLVFECWQKGLRAILVVDRQTLIKQAMDEFTRWGIPFGIMQADHWKRDDSAPIQIATVQTLERRGWPTGVSLILVDEAHTVYRFVEKRIIARDVTTIGFTATPFTPGLGKFYDTTVTVATTNWLIAERWLCPYRIFAPSAPDMDGVEVGTGGEWVASEVERRSMPIIGDIVAEYLKHAADRHFIAFASTKAHAEELSAQFLAAGVHTALFTSDTSEDERARILADFNPRTGYLRGLISVAALAKGFDAPHVSVVIIARPLRKSVAEHIQMFGRGLRKDHDNPDKVCLILDHAGNCQRFWDRMTDFFENGAPPLDDGSPRPKPKKGEAGERVVEPYRCPECTHIHNPQRVCPMCGHEYPKRASGVQHLPGKLSELTGRPEGGEEDKLAFYAQVLQIGFERGKPDSKWANGRFKARFGQWPPREMEDTPPATPTAATRNWIKRQAIAWAKGQEKRLR